MNTGVTGPSKDGTDTTELFVHVRTSDGRINVKISAANLNRTMSFVSRVFY